MSVKFISSSGIMLAVLSGTDFIILRPKVSQYFALILVMPGAMEKTSVFGSTPLMIYIPFSTLASTMTDLGVSI